MLSPSDLAYALDHWRAWARDRRGLSWAQYDAGAEIILESAETADDLGELPSYHAIEATVAPTAALPVTDTVRA